MIRNAPRPPVYLLRMRTSYHHPLIRNRQITAHSPLTKPDRRQKPDRLRQPGKYHTPDGVSYNKKNL